MQVVRERVELVVRAAVEADEEVVNLLKEKYGEKAQKIEDTDDLKRIIKISKYIRVTFNLCDII